MARQQRSFSDAINEGLLGLGNTGFQFAQAANEKRRTDAAMSQSDAATKASQAETKLRENEFARGLRQDALEKSLADSTKARMSLPQGVRADMPSDDELALWSQLTKTSPEEVKAKIMRSQGEASQVGLENISKKTTNDFNAAAAPIKLQGERLGNKKTQAEINKLNRDANKPAKGEDSGGLPLESKELVKALASKNANKIAIANQIQGYLDQFNTAIQSKDKDLALRIANQSLKVLNSPEGADAIGAEESARLGDALKIKFFNVTEPGPMFGRDLPGFGKQMQTTIQGVRGAVDANRGEIDKIYGRTPQAQSEIGQRSISQGSIGRATPPSSAHPQDSEAVAWAKSNPNDPRSAQILKMNGL